MNKLNNEPLMNWGWTSDWEQKYARQRQELSLEPEESFVSGRVLLEHTHMYRVATAAGEVLAEVSGRLRHTSSSRSDYPAVGDWVILRLHEPGKGLIYAVLQRSSAFVRKAAGSMVEEQIVAANIDTVMIVVALNLDYNLRRIERYLVVAWDSGAQPVIVLSKADLCDDPAGKVADVQSIAPGVPVHAVSAPFDEGTAHLLPYLKPGQTITMLGSSGAGKSSLVNRLYGDYVMETGDIRDGDDRGKHTTTHRHLLSLPSGALVIDTPGMRELQLWETDGGMTSSFSDIAEIMAQCRFTDCTHTKEPGCAVKRSLANGTLDHARYDSYLKLQRELEHLARKTDKHLMQQEKQRHKSINKVMKQRFKK